MGKDHSATTVLPQVHSELEASLGMTSTRPGHLAETGNPRITCVKCSAKALAELSAPSTHHGALTAPHSSVSGQFPSLSRKHTVGQWESRPFLYLQGLWHLINVGPSVGLIPVILSPLRNEVFYYHSHGAAPSNLLVSGRQDFLSAIVGRWLHLRIQLT